MLFLFPILSIQIETLYPKMWRSGAVWKYGLKMNDPNYLPIVPIFTIFKPDEFHTDIIADRLLTARPKEFTPHVIIHELNNNINTTSNLDKLKKYCDENISHACLILGRIHEFGSINQTEDQEFAYKYYVKVRDLNDSSSLPMLSFYHRFYNIDFQSSVIENDFAVNFLSVESLLSSSLQYETGVIRPLSCPTAATYLSWLAQTTIHMKYHLRPSIINQTEVERISQSTNAEDKFKYAMHILDVPYPSEREIKIAKRYLKSAFKNGLPKAGAVLAKLYIDGLQMNETVNVTTVLKYLKQSLSLDDPLAFTVLSELFVAARVNPQFLPLQHLHKMIDKAAKSGYPPAIHQVGILTYLGLLGIPRSDSKGQQLFSQASAKGYAPSQYTAARGLVGGDGVVENCPAAVSMFRRIVDLGPWSEYFEKYVEKGSKHAFLKMLDMQLTPPKWLYISNQEDGTDKEKNNSLPMNVLLKMVEANFNSLDDEQTVEAKIKHLRNARDGDPASILWLSLHSSFSESLEWIHRLLLLPVPTCYLAYFVKIYILLRAVHDCIYDTFPKADKSILEKELKSYLPELIFLVISATLMILISVRVNIMFA